MKTIALLIISLLLLGGCLAPAGPTVYYKSGSMDQLNQDYAACEAQALQAVLPMANTDPWYAIILKIRLRDLCMQAKGYSR